MHFATFICDFLVKPTSGTGLLGSRTLNTFASTTQALFRESFKKKTGLFSDIDQIYFDTHTPPPKDDIYEKMTKCWKVYHPPTVEK